MRDDKLSPQQYALIGECIIQWAALEEVVVGALPRFMRMETRQALGFTKSIRGLETAINMLRAIWEPIDLEIYSKELLPLLKKVRELHTKRNMFAHRPWYPNDDSSIFSFDGKPLNYPFAQPDFISIDDLSSFLADVNDVMGKLDNFIEARKALVFSGQDRFQ